MLVIRILYYFLPGPKIAPGSEFRLKNWWVGGSIPCLISRHPAETRCGTFYTNVIVDVINS